MLMPPSFFLELTVVEVSVVAGSALGGALIMARLEDDEDDDNDTTLTEFVPHSTLLLDVVATDDEDEEDDDDEDGGDMSLPLLALDTSPVATREAKALRGMLSSSALQSFSRDFSRFRSRCRRCSLALALSARSDACWSFFSLSLARSFFLE
jgi:hypothetical protein